MCIKDSCDQPIFCKKLCGKHYRYQRFLELKDSLEYKAQRKIISRRYYLKNTTRILQYSKEWIHLNKKHAAQTRKNYSDSHKALRVEIAKRYQKKHPDKVKIWKRISCANRRSRVLSAMPAWLTKEQKKDISLFYKNCPEGYEVDHIIPLRGKIVCGLHVPWNLQYLTAEENLKKGNRLISQEKNG